jgi:AcrR family transcriptional regulator
VPSTRQIAREWGVAIATATRALTTLVQAVPRVGTVVAALNPDPFPPRALRRPAQAPEQELTQARIVRAAVDIADVEGLPALSMRGVTAELGVATMSLYRHVPTKDVLILLMADAVLGEGDFPEPAPPGWRAQVAVTIAGYVQATAVNLESEIEAQQDTGMTSKEWMESQDETLTMISASGRFPMLSSIAAQSDFDFNLDTLFEFGLKLLLDGLAVRIRRPRT